MGLLSTNTKSGLASALGSRSGAEELEGLLASTGRGENVLRHGASPTPGFDNTSAIKAAIAAAVRNKTYHVHFPAGTYEVQSSNVLHPVTAGVSSGFGIHFTGDSQNYTILKLMNDGSTTRWFYDSLNSAGWNRCQFENLWFQGSGGTAVTSANAYTNGFRIWASIAAGGVDKGFIFRNCRNDYLGTPLQFTGTANTDSFNAYSCWYSACGPVIIENDQALILNWYSCHFWTSDDTFWMKNTAGMGQAGKGGGGSITLRDCDIINFNVLGDTTSHYTVRIDDGTAFYRTWLFDHCKWELRNPESRLVYWPGTASPVTGSEIIFDRCDISVMQQGNASYGGGGNDTNGRRDIIVLGPAKRLKFISSYFADQLGIVFQDVNTGNVFTFAYQPLVEFEGCGLPEPFIDGTNSGFTADDATRGLPNRVTLSSSYGRVVARKCFLRDHSPKENYAVDFDYGNRHGDYGETQVETKKAELKSAARAWPTSGVFSRTLRIPQGSIVTAAYLWEPAQGSSSTTKQVLLCHKQQAVESTQSGTGSLVQVNITAHGLVNGDKVFIEGVGGTTEANGYWTVSNATTNNFTLTGVTFVNAWTSGGNVYRALIESTSGRSDAEHKASMSRETSGTKFPMQVSSFADRKFWLIATAGSLSKTGGYVYLEYE